MGLYDFTFYDVINTQARQLNTQPAWFEDQTDTTITFGEYKTQVDCLAAGIRQLGVTKGARIAVVGQNSLAFFTVYGAAVALGAIVVPINWRLSPDETLFNINDTSSTVLFGDSDLLKPLADKPELRTYVEHIYTLDQAESDYPTIDTLMAAKGTIPLNQTASDDPLVIIHTAAVSGQPRGAILTHANALYACLQLAAEFGDDAAKPHLNLLPLFHVAGLFMALQTFCAGGLNVNMTRFDADRAVALIDQKKTATLFTFPPILGTILDAQEKTGADISALKCVLGLEAPDMIQRYQKVTGGTFRVLYGQTEASGITTIGPHHQKPGSAGRPVPLARVDLFDAHDKPVEHGEIGEIVQRGPLVFKGYWNRHEDNAASFANGWHHTGDLGRFDEDGYLWYEGRKADKELIKPGGENVYPAEVEQTILQHPAVAKVVVFGVPDAKWKEAIKAVCQLKPGENLSEKELIAFVGEKIARYKKPHQVEFLEELPTDEDGKIDRAAVKKDYGTES